MDDFVPNSHRFKERQAGKVADKKESKGSKDPEPKHKVVKSAVKVKKKNFFTDLFLPEDVQNAKDYIMQDIIIPLIKKGLSETLDSILYPDGRGRRHSDRGTRVSYASYYDDDRRPSRRERERESSRKRNRSFENVIFETKGEALDVLDEMERSIEKYGQVTLREFYELVDVPGRYTDVNYGWRDLRNVDACRDRGGYSLNLPSPETLD